MRQKYKVKHNFFSKINSERKAYLLGFYLGDGSVGYRDSKKEYSFRVGVSETDSYITTLFSDSISKRPVYKTKGQLLKIDEKTYKCKPALIFSCYSKQIFTDLSNFGYGIRKTYLKKKLPKIDKKYIRHFLRGYFDADGTCTNNLVYRGDRPIGTRAKSVFKIPSYDDTILIDIQKFLLKELNVTTGINPCRRSKTFVLQCSRISDMLKIYDYFYKNSKFFLRRKKKSFETIMLTPRELREIKSSKLRNA